MDTTGKLQKILPPNLLKDTKIKAAAQALDAELDKLQIEIPKVLHLPRLDELPHEVLDALAEQYNVIFYQPENMTAETKRKLIRQALLDHKINGTKFAVENMLNRLTKGAQITEWFQYDGTPYHFKMDLKGLQDYSDGGQLFMKIVEATKNLRSHLDAVDFDLSKLHPDEILHVAQVLLFLGNLKWQLESQFKDKHKLHVWQYEIEHGRNFYATNSRRTDKLHLYAGFIHFTHGNVRYAAQFEVTDDDWYSLWLRWIESRWKKWKPADIFWFDDDDEDEDEDEPEIFGGSFLKLYIDYHNSDCTRVLKIYNPREDITADDIKAVNVDNLFIKRRKYLSNHIFRATYCDVTKIKIL